jgi:hypothetical protein
MPSRQWPSDAVGLRGDALGLAVGLPCRATHACPELLNPILHMDIGGGMSSKTQALPLPLSLPCKLPPIAPCVATA